MEPSIAIQSAESRAAKTIREVFESGRPLTYVRTSEEQRVGRVLREVSLRLSSGRVLQPTAEQRLAAGDTLVLAGMPEALQAAEERLTTGG